MTEMLLYGHQSGRDTKGAELVLAIERCKHTIGYFY